MLAFIRKLLLSTLRWVPISHGFGHFSGFLHNSVFAKLSTSNIRVKMLSLVRFLRNSQTFFFTMSISTLNPSNAKGFFYPKYNDTKIFENPLNPVMLVFIGKLLLSAIRWVLIREGFCHLSGFLHYLVLAKLTTTSIGFKSHGEMQFLCALSVELFVCSPGL